MLPPMRNTGCGNTCGIDNWKDASSGDNTRLATTSWILHAWTEKIVVELDGGQHAGNVPYDNARTSYLERYGFKVLRFWNNEVFNNIEGVAEVILNTLAQRATPSPPNPSLEGEG